MMQIHDTIRTSHCPIEVVATGDICSAGVLILACGDYRLVTESVSLMSHEGTVGEGPRGFSASRDRAKYDDYQQKRWAELMARYTPQTAKWWKLKTERQAEYWLLGGKEIVAAGLADEVIETRTPDRPEGRTKRQTPFFAEQENPDNG